MASFSHTRRSCVLYLLFVVLLAQICSCLTAKVRSQAIYVVDVFCFKKISLFGGV